MRIDDHGPHRVLHVDPVGPRLSTEADAVDLVGEAFGADASVLVMPVARLDPAFFDPSTRRADEFVQKLADYRVQLVVLGDVGRHEAASAAFRDRVRESNRGRHVWFVPDEGTLAARLAATGPRG
jgi:hypothetical protein